ncbi:Ankyrin repeat domain containing protein [Pandoravirus dulcis]|uniref:Ankyrin repeat domain containing protein n=1 Tax=Pandoravirus dulcis TaxID=1349409 RepID=S4VY58_9VIRU|nr:Ankyrin repeat domain containing protein [Pandoravirus dulcis]AGO82829.1 Ankyrin repeat domain containing protein [Pandoravirus dulcis]
METLPVEMVDRVLDFVGPLPHARAVCRQWHMLVAMQEERRPQFRLSAAAYMGLLGEHGERSAIEWARSSGCPWDASACAGAAKAGHLDLLRWLRRNGCPWDALTYGWALAKGHTEMISWLRDAGCPKQDGDMWKAAISGGHTEVVDYLGAHTSVPHGSCCWAAASGHIDILQWVKSRGAQCAFPQCCSGAAGQKGHTHVLDWLRDRGEVCRSTAMVAAAWQGRLDVIQWGVARGMAPSGLVGHAARAGHQHIIEWLRSRGEEWSAGITDDAAAFSHFDLLKWLYAQGCQLSTTTFYEAAGAGRLPILEWLRDRRCPLVVEECMEEAATPEAHTLIASCEHLDAHRTKVYLRTVDDNDDPPFFP